MKGIHNRRFLVYLIAVLALVSIVTVATAVHFLYSAAFEEARARLTTVVTTQAQSIESAARSNNFDADATLEQIKDALLTYTGFGDTGEFGLGYREGETIYFLLPHRGYRLEVLSFDSDLGEPMREALLGRSGTMVGKDYRGVDVLAAYQPIRELNWGLVAKIDMAEIRSPFVRAVLIASAVGVISILLGSALYVRICSPFLRRLQESEETTRAVLDSAVDGVITIDGRGVIETVNPAAEQMFGYKSAELMGRNVKMLMPSPYQEQHDSYVSNYLRSGEKKIIGIGREVLGRRKDGTTFPLDLAVSEARVGQKRVFAGILRDITERKQVEEQLRTGLAQQEFVANVGRHALSGQSLQAVMDEAASVVAENLGAEYAKILELLPDRKALLLRAGVGWRDGNVGQTTVGADRASQAGYTLLCDKPVIVEDLNKETRFSGPRLLLDHGVRSGISVIIYGDKGPFGVLGVHSKEPQAFTETDANFVQSIANILGEAVRHQADQRKLIERESLARLGEMAAVVAHEVNKPLAGIAGALRIFQEQSPTGSVEHGMLDELVE